MFIISLISWFAYTSVLVVLFMRSFKSAKYGSFFLYFFSLYYLSIRPVFIFLGLDVPIPFYEFQYDFYGDIARANLIVMLWVGVLFLTQSYFEKIFLSKVERKPYNVNFVNLNYLFFLTAFMTLLGVMVTSFFILKFGSLSEFLYQVKIEKSMKGLYVFREFSAWALILTGYLFLNSKLIGAKYYVVISVMLISVNGLFIFFWGNRTTIGFFIFMLGVLYFSRFQRINIKTLFLSTVLLFVIANGLRLAREDLHSEAIGHEVNSLEAMGPITALSLSMHLSEYDGLVLASRDVGKRFAFRDGEDFYNGLLAWVPRFLWKDKPLTHNVGLWFRQVYERDKNNGWPITAVGDWFVNGSWLYVFFGAALTGIIAAFLDSYCNKSLFVDYTIVIFSVFALGQGIDPGFIQTIFLKYIPVFILLYFAKSKIRFS
ncbi:hypothetical protein C6Y40_23765 [Alteromonas alba]|uniref:Oligosaccharide repeat unit polymerase n=2 Tax=Alteromonas alba TaxID=2079529 RepID=A0A2S9V3W3_9ALTE|nr:hypothetical protein C6Y40_23765 [Alteromonas alba]